MEPGIPVMKYFNVLIAYWILIFSVSAITSSNALTGYNNDGYTKAVHTYRFSIFQQQCIAG